MRFAAWWPADSEGFDNPELTGDIQLSVTYSHGSVEQPPVGDDITP